MTKKKKNLIDIGAPVFSVKTHITHRDGYRQASRNSDKACFGFYCL